MRFPSSVLSWEASVGWQEDLCFEVNRLQTVQAKARVQDLVEANRLLDFAVKTRDRGIFYSCKGPKVNDSIILSVTDASHAASFTDLGGGRLGGNRSQSGRIFALAPRDYTQKGDGTVSLLAWTSTTIKRVCRSTMQAETLSLQLGAEEAELKGKERYVKACDAMTIGWLTDCRSLYDHLLQPGMSEVTDKRLAIDLTALRQDVWRDLKEEVLGNPTYADAPPSAGTNKVAWVDAATMAADGLTKRMKCDQLELLMRSGHFQVSFEKLGKHEKQQGSSIRPPSTDGSSARQNSLPSTCCVSPVFIRLCSRCGAVCIFTHGGHFPWQAQGKPCVLVVSSRPFVTGARDQSGFSSKCRFRGRRSTFDMVVIVEELRFRGRCSES